MGTPALANAFNIVTDLAHAIYLNPPQSPFFQRGDRIIPSLIKRGQGRLFNKYDHDCKPKVMHMKNDLIDTPRENATMLIHIHHQGGRCILKGLP
jgi:hypothetical protein